MLIILLQIFYKIETSLLCKKEKNYKMKYMLDTNLTLPKISIPFYLTEEIDRFI